MSYETLSNTLRDIDRERKEDLDKQEKSILKKSSATPKLVSKANQKKNKNLLQKIIPKKIQSKQILKESRMTVNVPAPKAIEKVRSSYFNKEYEKERRSMFR